MTAGEPLMPGDAFVLGDAQGFGVILSVNPASGRALVLMQNGRHYEALLPIVEVGRELLKPYEVTAEMAQAQHQATQAQA